MVAPVPPVGLDQVGREDLAGVEGDDRDLLFVDDGEDAPAGTGCAHVEVVQAARPAQGDGALAVGNVVAEAEVAPGSGAGGQCPRRRPVRLAGRRPADRSVRPLLVVDLAEGVELALEGGDADRCRLAPEPALRRGVDGAGVPGVATGRGAREPMWIGPARRDAL